MISSGGINFHSQFSIFRSVFLTICADGSSLACVEGDVEPGDVE
jgi:hypothetical protein